MILRIGAAGLGRAFALMAPTLAGDPRVKLAAAADPRAEARSRFEQEFGGKAYDSVEALCASDVDVVYVATPHQFHAEHVRLACARGKHVLVEKPMALSPDECRSMIDAARKAGAQLVVGHSHSFDLPVLHAQRLIEGKTFGAVRMITALNFTDFLYRPRRPEELDTSRGGGAVYNQAAHHVDMARLLAGAPVRTVRAMTGAWDPARPTEGAYSCLLGFANGVFATLTYSGYAHFDSDELTSWYGESGQRKDPAAYGAARRALSGDELALKYKDFSVPRPAAHAHFGFLIVSCDRADLKIQSDGVTVYGDAERRLEALPAPAVPRATVIDELYDAVANRKPPLHDGAWGLSTLEVCLAILRSAREGTEIIL